MDWGSGEKVQKADPEYRRKVLVWMAVAVLITLALAHYARSHFSQLYEWLWAQPEHESQLRMFWATVGIGILGVLINAGCGWYCWRFSKKIYDSGRFPPPGVRVLSDVPILEGDSARSRAHLLRGLSLLFIVTAFVFGCLFLGTVSGMLSFSA